MKKSYFINISSTMLVIASLGFSFGVATLKNRNISTNDDEIDESNKKKRAEATEILFYENALTTLYQGSLNWDDTYYGKWDKDDILLDLDEENFDIFETNLYKASGYAVIYQDTELFDKYFYDYIREIVFGYDNAKDVLQACINEAPNGDLLNLPSINDLSQPWSTSICLEEIGKIPSVKLKTLQSMYSNTFLWQKNIGSGARYDFNLTRELASQTPAFVWNFVEKGSSWPGDIVDASNNVKSGLYSGDEWNVKTDNSTSASSHIRKQLTLLNDNSDATVGNEVSKGFDNIYSSSSKYSNDSIHDFDNSWEIETSTGIGRTIYGDYSFKSSQNPSGTIIASENSAKFVKERRQDGTNLYGVSREDSDFKFSKTIPILPARFGVESSWDNTQNHYREYKFRFNYYETTDGTTDWITDVDETDGGTITSIATDMWEYIGIDATNFDIDQLAFEVFILNNLQTSNSNIFTQAKRHWYNKGFYIELYGQEKEDLEHLIDSDLIK